MLIGIIAIFILIVVVISVVFSYIVFSDASFEIGLPIIPFTFPYKTKIKEHVVVNGKGEQVEIMYSCWAETVLWFYRPIIIGINGKHMRYYTLEAANYDLEKFLIENKKENKSSFL